MKTVDDIDSSEDLWVGQWDPASLELTDITQAGEQLKASSRSKRAAATASDDLPEVVIKTSADGRIIDRAYTSSSSNWTDPDSGRTRFQCSVGTSSVELGWWTPSDDVEWTIKRNDKVIAHTKDIEYTDTTVDRRKGSTYSVTGAHKYTDEDGKEQESKFVYGTSAPPAPADVRGQKIDDPKVQDVTANTDIAGVSTQAATTASATLTFSSFIPDKTIPYPPACGPLATAYDRLGGDNRGFNQGFRNPIELSHRIANQVNINWIGDKARQAAAIVDIGTTRGYKNGKLVDTAVANKKDSFIKATPEDGSTALVKMKQNASDPLCKVFGADAPDINAELSTFMWGPTGFHTLVGKHDGAPNYEYNFTYQKGRSAQTIGCSYRFKRGLCEELLPPMDVDVDVSWTPNGARKKVCPTFTEGWA